MTGKGNTIPEIRFAGFTADWNETQMGKLLSFKNGYNAGKEQYGTGKKFINVLDIIENDYITHDRIIGQVEIPANDFGKNEVKFGDILFQRSSETREEVGQANVYLDRDKTATFGGFVIRGRPLIEFDPIFLNSMLKTAKARKDITSRSGGSTRYNIGQESLEDVLVSIAPTLPEQRKIADFLTAVDGRIGQLIQKKSLLEDYKKGVMQQLFTQAIRFKDDHGNDFPDWEEKKLGEMLTFKNGYNASKEQYGSGKKFINVLDIIENDYITHERIIGEVDIPQKDFEKNEVRFGDILFQRSSETREEVGQANVYLDQDKTATFGGFVIRGRPLVEFNPVYFNSMLKTSAVRKDMTSRSGGSTRYNIGQESLEKVTVIIATSLPEQTKIANFLSAIDRKIESVATQIAETQTFKRGLLQQMFV